MASTRAAKDVILSDSSTYYQWYENTRGFVPNHLWRYFDPESNAVFIEPIEPVEPVNESSSSHPSRSVASGTRASTETLEQQSQREDQHYRERMEIYFKRHNIYRDTIRQWEKYNEWEAKLRERILATVAQQKAASLVAQNSVRQWLTDLKGSTQPPKASVKQNIRVEYSKLMGVGLLEWPSNGPSAWLGKWEDLIYRAKQYDEPLPNWLEDVSMVWQRVPDLHVYFKTIELDIQEENVDKHSCASISAKIQQHWERKKQSLTLRYSKPRSTRSAFATQEVTFDGEGATAPLSFTSGDEAKPDDAAKPKVDKKKRKRAPRSKTLGRGRRDSSTERQNQTRSRSPKIEGRSQSQKFEDQSRSSKSKDRKNPDKYTDPCKACGGAKHGFSSCFLVKGEDKDWLSEENRKTFNENMKIPQFKKTVDEFRKLLKSVNSFQ